MSKTIGLLTRTLALTLCLFLLSTATVPAQDRSILLIVADDLGVDVAKFYRLNVGRLTTNPPAPPTPNLAALARNGVVFRHAWATPWCSPTRAALLTGRYPFRTGIGVPISHIPTKANAELRLGDFTLPRAFQRARPDHYLLAHVGKWHLSRQSVNDPNLAGWPYFVGPRPDNSAKLDNHYDWSKTRNGVTTDHVTRWATSDEVDEAVAFIRGAKDQGRPYFVWLALSAVHGPYQKAPNPLHTRDALPDTGASDRAYFETMVQAVDTEIGRLLQDVDLTTTTVIFMGDNGTPGEVTAAPYPTDRMKGTVYEGGVRVPLLVAGAGVVAPGRVVNRVVSAVDLFPTILALAGIDPAAAVPPEAAIDGVSILPYLENRTGTALRRYAYSEAFAPCWNNNFQRAIANDRYKLIRRKDGSGAFYDLVADPYERTDLLPRTLTTAQRSNLNTLTRNMTDLLATGAGPCVLSTAPPDPASP